jgi:hypothetical protein
VLTILDGGDQHRSGEPAGQQWYDRIFAHTADATSFLFAVDPIELPTHPAPFDMFKLWQIYCDNVHPLNKILHAPSFQRKMSTYGAQLHLAPSSDQALFFAVYVAALTSISPEECEAIFYTNREVLLDQYKLAAQVWLRRAGIWRTSELSVLQAFVLFLSSIQNVVDPRSISCFTGVAERNARRMGLHRDASYRKVNALEQEVRRRVWWELLFLDARASERLGLGTSVLTDNWTVRLPSNRSDADLESLQGAVLEIQSQPSSEVIFHLVRAEATQFLANLRNQRSMQGGGSELMTLTRKLQKVDEFERRLQSRLLCFCDSALPHHRLTIMFAQLILSRMRMSIYTVEEIICRNESRRKEIGLELVQQCILNLKAYIDMRKDVSLNCYKWFMLQNLPILGYIHLLRLLQVHVNGEVVDQAWQVIEDFRNTGVRLAVDSLTLKAWNARVAASSDYLNEPSFIAAIKERRSASTSTDMLPYLKGSSMHSNLNDTSPSESDIMAMLDEMMSAETNNEFDWPSWINE